MTADLPLIVTRPEPGNAATVAQAKKLGLDARAMPLFAARALEWVAPASENFDALLLTSAFAAKLAGADLARLSSLPVYAVGAATARAAEAAGLTVVMTGLADAQRLLDDMASQDIRTILWLCGRDRSKFEAHGAMITALPCYAVEPVQPPADWSTLIAAPAIILAHSARAAQRISGLVGGARGHLTLIAISASAGAAAGEGWRDLAIAGQPNDAAMLAEARALWHKGAK